MQRRRNNNDAIVCLCEVCGEPLIFYARHVDTPSMLARIIAADHYKCGVCRQKNPIPDELKRLVKEVRTDYYKT
jgi:hypothetical protein